MLHSLMAGSINLIWICSHLLIFLLSKEKCPAKYQCLHIFSTLYLTLPFQGLYFLGYLLPCNTTLFLLDHCCKCRNPLQSFPCLNIASSIPHHFLATPPFLSFPSWSFRSIFYNPIFYCLTSQSLSHTLQLEFGPHQSIKVVSINITFTNLLLIQMDDFQYSAC